ncbi:hypothetical protein [Gallibacterium genomosp. 3]|uniref:ABC transporter substrate-binding protein n=1 Tax=Gallibacterium genomosp. 3 TaxID=505345 RepID=A0A1A7Q787_9PAST|nr:hypothetical protein QV07_04445 [Gallibacterium genomosp. 3]
MKKFKLALWATLAATTLLTGNTIAAEMKNVAITAIVEHPALDAVRQGTIAELKKEGFWCSRSKFSHCYFSRLCTNTPTN